MATATGLTAIRMLEIERASVVSARRENGELILTTRGGTDINVGDVTGLQGPPGPDGASRYTWLKYADSPTSGMADDPTGKNYIGIAYNKTVAIESNNYADYNWTLIRGPEGQQGVPGPPGDDGEPTYVWIKYAIDAVGTDMSNSPTGKDYVGFAYNKTTPVESTDPADYAWALIKGPKGDPGDPGADGLPGPPGDDGTPNFTWLKYASTPTTGMSDDPTGKDYIGLSYNRGTAIESTDYNDYTWSLIRGPQGNQGVPGTPGADGTPRFVWIKYANSIIGDGLSDDPTGKSYIGLAYNKTTAIESTEPLDYTWSLYKGPAGTDGRGITASEITYQAAASGVLIPTGTWLTDPPALSAGQYLWTRTRTSYNAAPFEVMSYSVGQMGQTGAPGTPGITITAAVVRYQISNNGVTPPGGTWLSSPPAGSPGQWFWTRTVTSYSQGSDTIAYSVALLGQTGPPGTDGQPSYVWIKYADTILGEGLSDGSEGKAYIGIAYNKSTVSESTNPADYQWTLIQSTPLIVGTQSGVTGSWTGVAPFSILIDGQQITYWLPFDGLGDATLNLTLSGGGSTGPINCYYSGSTRLNTHMVAGNAVRLTYRVNADVAGVEYTGWWADGQYVDGNTHDRVQYNPLVLAKANIDAGQIIAGDPSGFAPLIPGYTFDVTIPILYAQTAIVDNASGNDNYTSFPDVNLQNTKAAWTGTIYESVFLKGSLQNKTFTVSDEVFTDNPIDDGSFYILLGQLYNTTSIALYSEHPIFRFYQAQFKTLGQIASDALAMAQDALETLEGYGFTIDSITGRLGLIEDDATGLPELRRVILSVQEINNGKNSVKRSTDNPGTSPGISGDQWFKYGVGNQLVGFWIHDSNGWVETKLNSAVFGDVSANAITSGTLDTNLITITNFTPDIVDGLTDTLTEIGGTANGASNSVTRLTNVIKITPDGINIGAGATAAGQTSFSMNLDSDSLDFLEDGVMVAQVTSRKLKIRDAEIATESGTSALLAAHEIVVGGTGALLNKITVFRSR